MAVVVLLVVVVGAVVGGGALVTALGGRARGIAVAVAGGVVVVVVLAMAVGVGLRGVGSDDEGSAPPPTPTTATPATTATEAVASSPTTDVPSRRPTDVVLGAAANGLPAPDPVVDRLDELDTVLVEAAGLPAESTGAAYQCRAAGAACTASVPVQADGSGVARVVVPVAAEVDGVPCRAACVLVVDVDGTELAADLVFGAGAPPPPTLRLAPTSARPGDVVTATVSGLEPRAEVAVRLCTAAGPACGGSASERRGRAGGEGVAVVEYLVGETCERGARCGIVAVGPDGDVLSTTATLRILGVGPVEHDGRRLAIGLAVAAALALAATWLTRTTDWRAVGLPSTTDDA